MNVFRRFWIASFVHVGDAEVVELDACALWVEERELQRPHWEAKQLVVV